MKKYKVILQLMIDPSKGDQTFDKEYIVEAESKIKAYWEAEKMQSNDVPNIRLRSVFNYTIKEI